MFYRILSLDLEEYSSSSSSQGLPSMEDLPRFVEEGSPHVEIREFEAPTDNLAVALGRALLWDSNITGEDTVTEIERKFGDRWESISIERLSPILKSFYRLDELCSALSVDINEVLEELGNAEISWGSDSQQTLCHLTIIREICEELYIGDDFEKVWNSLNLCINWVSID